MENPEEEATKKNNVFSKVYENIRSEMNHRSKSRFIGSYVISWIIVNWKAPIFLFFADIPLVDKLKSSFCAVTPSSWSLPLLGVVIYIIIIPFLEDLLLYINDLFLHPLKISKLHLEHKSLMAQLKKNIALEQERNRLISEMSNESETKKLIDNNKFLSEQLELLKKNLESKDEIIVDLESKVLHNRKSLNNDFTENQIRIIRSTRAFSSLLKELYNNGSNSTLKANVNKDIAGYLIARDLIKEDDLHYVLTVNGISFVENYLL